MPRHQDDIQYEEGRVKTGKPVGALRVLSSHTWAAIYISPVSRELYKEIKNSGEWFRYVLQRSP